MGVPKILSHRACAKCGEYQGRKVTEAAPE